jgi:hypothetical protein
VTVDPAPGWLPPLLPLSEAGGDWSKYVERLYDIFREDFVTTGAHYEGKRCAFAVHPRSEGKEKFFWHLISEGEKEEERIPDLRRCERIRWPKPVIQRRPEQGVLVWGSTRGKHTRLQIALPDFSYLVVLEDRVSYLIAITAFCVEKEHRRVKLKKEYENYVGGK